jgi:molybdate transport system substrate-binding protein
MKFHSTIALGGLLLMQMSFAGAQQPAAPQASRSPILGENVSGAKANEIRIIASGSMMVPIQSVQAQADKATGKHLVIEYGAARAGLRDEIINGQDFEVAVLVPDVNDELVQKGLAKSQRFAVVRMPVGIGYTGDGPAPEVSTPAALKKTLLGAKGVMYSPMGAGAPTAKKILSSLGIADAVKFAGAGSDPSSPLARGEYTISIFPASEIVANHNVKYLGPVIDDFQIPVVVEAVIGAHARDPKAAAAFIGFLQGPEFAQVLKQHGMVMAK